MKRYATAHGRRFEIGTLDTTPHQKRQTTKQQEAYARIPLQWSAEMAQRINSPRTAILILLAYLAWDSRNTTFQVSNDMLRRYGIDRWAKYRAFAVFERAGVIKIGRRGKQSLTVTLLKPPGT